MSVSACRGSFYCIRSSHCSQSYSFIIGWWSNYRVRLATELQQQCCQHEAHRTDDKGCAQGKFLCIFADKVIHSISFIFVNSWSQEILCTSRAQNTVPSLPSLTTLDVVSSGEGSVEFLRAVLYAISCLGDLGGLSRLVLLC